MNCLDLLCCNCHLPPNPSPAYINSAGCCFLLCLFSSFTNFLIFLTLLYNPHQQLLLFSCNVLLSCGWFSFLLRDNVFNLHNLLPGLSGSSSVFHGLTEGRLDGLPTGHPLLSGFKMDFPQMQWRCLYNKTNHLSSSDRSDSCNSLSVKVL